MSDASNGSLYFGNISTNNTHILRTIKEATQCNLVEGIAPSSANVDFISKATPSREFLVNIFL
jgi:hypothetical protein